MYSDNNRRASVRRANDEFLRRMIGGELTGADLPVMNVERPALPDYSQNGRTLCDGTVVGDHENTRGCGEGECPTCIHAPALAMVYSPKQCWQNMLDPQSALENGSMFAELILPFEGGCGKHRDMEVRTRK